MQQVSYGPLIMSIMLIVSIMLIMSCYTGFFNVRRGWQSLNKGPRFYLRLIRRTGRLWIYTSHTTDGCPFKPKKLSVQFLYPGVSVWLVEESLKTDGQQYIPSILTNQTTLTSNQRTQGETTAYGVGKSALAHWPQAWD